MFEVPPEDPEIFDGALFFKEVEEAKARARARLQGENTPSRLTASSVTPGVSLSSGITHTPFFVPLSPVDASAARKARATVFLKKVGKPSVSKMRDRDISGDYEEIEEDLDD